MILVELAGAAGVGKSTIAPLLAQKLREHLGTEAVAALPETGVPRSQRHWTRLKRWLWLASHPSAYFVARRLVNHEIKVTVFSTWVRVFSIMGVGRRLTKKGLKVVLVDQGMLRPPMFGEHVPLLPGDLLPDLVLQLIADPVMLELRRIYRSKTQHSRVSGDARMQRGSDVRQRLNKLPHDELKDALTKFGQRYCEPPLSSSEVEELLQTKVDVQETPDEAAAASGRCKPAVCEGFKQRGVQWLEIDNSRMDGMAHALDQCVQAILSRLAVVSVKP